MTDWAEEFSQLYVELLDDAASSFVKPSGELSAAERRTFVRALFAYIEGTTYAYKQTFLNLGLGAKLSDAEKACLREETYSVNDRGEVVIQTATIRCLSNIRLAFAISRKVARSRHNLDISGEGWQCLRKSLVVRHRLTHPKKRSDLDVSDEEVEDAKTAFRWFTSNVNIGMIEAYESFRDILKSAGDGIKELLKRGPGTDEEIEELLAVGGKLDEIRETRHKSFGPFLR